MKSIYLQIPDLLYPDSNLVLATVTGSYGSTPQKPGSSALFRSDGIIAGTVGGGIVEGKVQRIALEGIISKRSGHFTFDLANDISKSDEAICGGKISVLVDASLSNHISVFNQLKQSVQDRIPGVLITMVTVFDKASVLINRYWMTDDYIPGIHDEFLAKITPVVRELLSSGNPSEFRELELSIPGEEPSSTFFLEPVFPPERLIIAGAGHIGKSLSHLGRLLGFNVTVIDDRQEFANDDNLPDADHIIVKDIGAAMNELEKSSDTYAVIVTHGHKDDASALKPCFGSDMAYVGMIGSRKKISAMRNHFIENGWATSEQWDKIYAPVGLDIKSQTVEEIAVSIAAQLVQVRNSRKSGVNMMML